MALDRVCPHCDGEKVKFGETCWWCDGMGRVVQPDIVLTPIPSPTPPQITHHCPACEAAARERDELRRQLDESEEVNRTLQARIQRLVDGGGIADLRARLAARLRLWDETIPILKAKGNAAYLALQKVADELRADLLAEGGEK